MKTGIWKPVTGELAFCGNGPTGFVVRVLAPSSGGYTRIEAINDAGGFARYSVRTSRLQQVTEGLFAGIHTVALAEAA